MVDEQKIKVKIVLELVGMPKEHVETTMGTVMKKVMEDKKFKILDEKIYPVEKVKDTKSDTQAEFWSTFADIELEVQGFDGLSHLCFEYMPSSIDIIEPVSLGVSSINASQFLNDILAKLHGISLRVSNMQATLKNQEIENKKKES